MAVQVESALDEPVVIFRFNTTLDEQTIREANAETDELLDILGTFYAVLDVSDLTVQPSTIAKTLRRYNFKVLTEPRIAYVFVDQPDGQSKTFKMPVFDNIDAAREHINIELAHRKPGASIREASQDAEHG